MKKTCYFIQFLQILRQVTIIPGCWLQLQNYC